MAVAIVGGAGYIGSHVVDLLRSSGETVVVVDDFSTGVKLRVDGLSVLDRDISSDDVVPELTDFFRSNNVGGVMHFAAKKQVPESVTRPMHYYRTNVGGTANLLDACEAASVRDFVFSSSAAVYGAPTSSLVDETSTVDPINPYGESKLAAEWLVRSASRAKGFRVASLRYFNVVGAASSLLADMGQFNLVPILIGKASRGEQAEVFGSDYDTLDGTCVRDYVDVRDLADAHLAALRELRRAPRSSSAVYNVGTGVGTSVSEVVELVEDVSGLAVEQARVARRPGDPASLTADVDLIHRDLGWSSRYSVRDAVESAWAYAVRS